MMNGSEASRMITDENGTKDVFELAFRLGVRIVFEEWEPITFGEFDKKTQRICINRRALGSMDDPAGFEKTVIAHELGHFAAEKLNLVNLDEEKFACEFAEELINQK